MSTFTRTFLGALCLVGCLLLPAAAGASATFGLTLTHTPSSILRTDEEIVYNATPTDLALVNPGEALTCSPKTWTGTPAPSFAFQWLRDGVSLGVGNGAATATYTVQAADAGHSLQCMVTGSNGGGSSAAASAPASVAPVPTGVTAPLPATATAASSRPTINGAGAQERQCVPPTGWNGAASWSYQWLRNGSPIPGATGERYLPKAGAGEPDLNTVLQCEVTAANSGGAAVSASGNSEVGTVTTPPANAVAQTPTFPNVSTATVGAYAVKVVLPKGMRVVEAKSSAGSSWVCSAAIEPTALTAASVECSRTTAIAAGTAAAQSLFVRAAILEALPQPAVATAEVSGGGAVNSPLEVPDLSGLLYAGDGVSSFGIVPGSFVARAFDASGANDETQAGGHPVSAITKFSLNSHVRVSTINEVNAGNRTPMPNGQARTIVTELPAGFIGNVQSAPKCTSSQMVIDTFAVRSCPVASVIGGITIKFAGEKAGYANAPIYNTSPERGVPAQFMFAFNGLGQFVYSLTARLKSGPNGYTIVVTSNGLPRFPEFEAAEATLCSYGAEVFKSGSKGGTENGHRLGDVVFEKCKKPSDPNSSSIPLLTNQTSCPAAPPVTTLRVDSWEEPGVFSDGRVATYAAPPMSGCDLVPFAPVADLRASSHQADSPTGLDVSITMPTNGLETAGGISQSELKKAVVRLPRGMAVNPAAADGLAACTQAELGMEAGVPNEDPVRCPDASKIGTAEVVTPLLEDPLQGSVYLAKQGDNPFHSLLGLYLVAESKERGILVKIPGKVEADPVTGQLVSTFDENPQVPFSSLKLHFNAGGRAPLLTPPKCGTYGVVSTLYPYAAPDEPVTQVSSFDVTAGPGGASCPAPDLKPKLDAGLANPVAGSASSFTVGLSREDGTDRFGSLDVSLPPGLTAFLKGVPYCPDSVLASIPEAEGSGQAQIDSPSCPAASQIGTVAVGVGGGSPFYVDTARAYLAGPYKGAPLSIAVVAPAVAGPFDLGTVVVRNAAYVNPETAQITVKSDPIPTILHGIPIDVRDIRVNVDRPDFTLAPTNCEEMSVGAIVNGENVGSAGASNRFQVGECAALDFNPKLRLRLSGATRRSGHPALRATLEPRAGDANIKRLSVALPHSEFLAQSHIRTICTRVQFNAGAGGGAECPQGSIYGKVRAWTPLLGYALEGPVILRSSSNPLPDLVAVVGGPASQPIVVAQVARIDSKNGGIRNSFESLPDAPISKVLLQLPAGRKSLLENSTDICRGTHNAMVKAEAQNGRSYSSVSKVSATCGRAGKALAKKAHRRHGASRSLLGLAADRFF